MNRRRGPVWAEHDAQDVRPYAITGGRTRPRHALRLVSLVAAGPVSPGGRLGPEAERALNLCAREPQSVAEIAAHLRQPVQVAKVLLSDLLDSGALTLAASAAGDPDVHILERLLVGLRKSFPDAA
ncbi:DUF742 domain-containing protein [Streptomyces sp. NPDC088732]|uniref:DUF742 domain-containing protein n=1 Tax=Streptomyces sp. NPDC088732 TaxID=3365879 RepID=UPI003826F7C7